MRKKRRCTATDPLIRQVFEEAERLGTKMTTLAQLSGLNYQHVLFLRNPNGKYRRGVKPTIEDIRQLSRALDFEFPDRLSKSH